MKAPEKIYVHVEGDKVTNTWNSTWIGVHDVEYIRKDAFIRKARKYFIKELPNFRSFMESGTAFIKKFESFIQEE